MFKSIILAYSGVVKKFSSESAPPNVPVRVMSIGVILLQSRNSV